jgi:hypothetical protein
MIQNENSEIIEDSAMPFENGGVDGMYWPEIEYNIYNNSIKLKII